MEKIQQALERARAQRAGAKVNDSVQEKSTQSIQHTQSVSGQKQLQQNNRILSAMEHSAYADAFKILSTQILQRMEEHCWSSLAITSVNTDAGKTTTAINLALSIAREVEYTVLLVDTNLRSPKLHTFFGITPELGLTDYLQNDIDLADVLVKLDNVDHLVILPGGSPILNSTEMLGSPKMSSLSKELKERYPKRIIIFDLPPVLNTADTLSFLPYVDCSVIVVEDDVTKRSELKETIDLLTFTNIIGTVLNKAKY